MLIRFEIAVRCALPLLGFVWGCAGGTGAPADPARSSEAPLATVEAEPAARSTAQPSTESTSPQAEPETFPNATDPGVPCGALHCRRYPDASAALVAVLRRSPEILAFGEAHALAGAHVATATERFERELLPLLAERGATELVVELLAPASGCAPTVESVRKEQQPVVEQQAEGNQDRFVQLGHTSRRLGIVPYILEPTCEEYQSVVDAGPDSIVRMLELIAIKSEQRLTRFWQKNQALQRPAALEAVTGPARLVLAYGGAMHNDIDVPPEKQAFAFGKKLLERTRGRYIALDLIVPEYIKSTEVWRALPWYPHFDATNAPEDVTLFQTDEHSYTLIFGTTQ